MKVFALFFDFLKMSDYMVTVSDPLNIQQLANIHISHIEIYYYNQLTCLFIMIGM